MKHVKVKSTNVESVGFENGKMHVKYKNGGTYEFSVTEEQHKALMEAPSIGSFLHKMNIRGTKLKT